MNRKSLLLISLLATMLLVVACGGAKLENGNAQPETATSAQTVVVSQQKTAPAPTVTEAATQPAGSDQIDSPAPQPISTNTVTAITQTWDDAEDVMRSGRILSESPVYSSPEADAEVVGEQDAGALVIVTRALDDWYEIIYHDGASRHAWLPQFAITFDALPVAAQKADATTTTETADDPTSEAEVVAEPVARIIPVSAQVKTAALSPSEQGVVVFQTSSGGSIYSMNADGSNLQLITTGGLDPALSPDSTQIAYARWDEPRGLFVANVDGTNERWLVGDNFVKNPTWSPDGTRITYNVQDGGRESKTITHPRFGEFTIPGTDFWRLQVVDVTGENLAGIADNTHSWNPDWSDYGILYAAEDGIYVTDPDGSPHQIFESSNAIRNPGWSPDGQTIIAMMEFHDHWEVVRINRDGTGLVRLDKNYDGVHSVAPTWSANGEQILYLSDRNGDWQLWVMDRDGANKHLLAPDSLGDIGFRYDFNAEHVANWR